MTSEYYRYDMCEVWSVYTVLSAVSLLVAFYDTYEERDSCHSFVHSDTPRAIRNFDISRAMAVCLTVMLGRGTAVLGINTLKILLDSSCETALYLFSGLAISESTFSFWSLTFFLTISSRVTLILLDKLMENLTYLFIIWKTNSK
jgi:hypothetical protein